MQSQRDVSNLGGTMRLGAYTAQLRPGSRAAQAYGTNEISERHRHRWEVSNAYRDVLAEYGLRLSGQSPDGGLVEMIELPDHAWFIGCQFHPELKSRPDPAASAVRRLRRRRAARTQRGGRRRPRRRNSPRSGADGAGRFARAPFLIAGPCVVEPGDVLPRVAEALARLAAARGLPVCFKASFDKANRARLASAARSGAGGGLRVLERVRPRAGCRSSPTFTRPAQAAPAAEVADVLQIPAFLCRQTDLLVAAGRTGRPVNVKKGQWMQAEAMAGAVEKVRSAGSSDVAVTERGTFFGYGDLVVDMRNFDRLREATGAPVIFDATHSVQQPGQGAAGASGGQREHIPALMRGRGGGGSRRILSRDPSGPGARAQRCRDAVAARPARRAVGRTLGSLARTGAHD